MRKTVLNTALWTALVMTIGVSVSACSSDKEAEGEVMAVDRVDEAAELAIKNGPKAEDMAFPETPPMAPATPTGEVDPAAPAEAATTTAEMPAATDAPTAPATATEMPAADTAEMPAADTTEAAPAAK